MVCNLIYASWIYIAGFGVYGESHNYTCTNLWESAITWVEEENEWTNDCFHTVHYVDFNNDSWTNFREYVVAAGLLSGGNMDRYVNLNCSDCVGMENYNPYYG